MSRDLLEPEMTLFQSQCWKAKWMGFRARGLECGRGKIRLQGRGERSWELRSLQTTPVSLLLLSSQYQHLYKLGKCHHLTAALGATELGQDIGYSTLPPTPHRRVSSTACLTLRRRGSQGGGVRRQSPQLPLCRFWPTVEGSNAI